MRARDLRGRGLAGEVGQHRAERIAPRVQLQPARVRFGDREGERVIFRLWTNARLSAQKRGPGNALGRVERVSRQAHVQDDGVEANRLRVIEQRGQLGPL